MRDLLPLDMACRRNYRAGPLNRHRRAPYIPPRHFRPSEVTDEEFDDFIQDKRSFNGTQLATRRIHQNLAVICAKYERSFEGESDIIDMGTLTILKDRGHLAKLPDKVAASFGKCLAIPDPIDPAFSEPPEDYDGKDEPQDEEVHDLEAEENENDTDDSEEDVDDEDGIEEESEADGYEEDSEMTELESEAEEHTRGVLVTRQNILNKGLGGGRTPKSFAETGYSSDHSSVSGYSTPVRRESFSKDIGRIHQQSASTLSSPCKDPGDVLAFFFGLHANVRTPTKNSAPKKSTTPANSPLPNRNQFTPSRRF